MAGDSQVNLSWAAGSGAPGFRFLLSAFPHPKPGISRNPASKAA